MICLELASISASDSKGLDDASIADSFGFDAECKLTFGHEAMRSIILSSASQELPF